MGMSLPSLAMSSLSNSGVASEPNPWEYTPLIGGDITVKETATNVFIQTTIDSIVGAESTNCVKAQFNVVKRATSACDFLYLYLQSSAIAIGAVSGAGTKQALSMGDGVTPLYVNGSNVGGNHGWAYLYKVVKTGIADPTNVNKELITYDDIGTHWHDAAGTPAQLTLVAIGDADTVYFLKEPTGDENSWTFNVASLNAGTLSQQNGTVQAIGGVLRSITATGRTITAATNLKDIVSGTNESINNKTFEVLLNGTTPAVVDATTTCKYLLIKETYYICNIYNEHAYIVAHMGTYTANPTWSATSPAVKVENYFVFEDYGISKIHQVITSYINFTIGAINSRQNVNVTNNAATYVGTTPLKKGYAPNVDPVDAEIDQDISTFTNTAREVVAAQWIDETKPPARLIQFFASDEFPNGLYGYAMGNMYGLSETQPADVLANSTGAYETTATKMYIRGFDDKYSTASRIRQYKLNGFFKCVKVRAYGTGQAYWYNEKNYAILYLDFHEDVTDETNTLPAIFNGKSYTILEKSAGMAVTGTLPALHITTTDTYNYAILKVQ